MKVALNGMRRRSYILRFLTEIETIMSIIPKLILLWVADRPKTNLMLLEKKNGMEPTIKQLTAHDNSTWRLR